jgi:hypothetical protein
VAVTLACLTQRTRVPLPPTALDPTVQAGTSDRGATDGYIGLQAQHSWLAFSIRPLFGGRLVGGRLGPVMGIDGRRR